MKKLFFLLILPILLLPAGCGNRGDNGPRIPEVPIPEAPIYLGEEPEINPFLEVNPFYRETLTIAVILDCDLRALADLYMELNPGVVIELVSLAQLSPGQQWWQVWQDLDFEEARDRIYRELLDGTAPVLLTSMLAPMTMFDPNYVQEWAADWMPLIEAHPLFTDDEWFMDVFRTAAGDDGLYFFPAGFMYDYVAVNKDFFWLTVEFDMRESITVRDLILFYEEYGGAYLGFGIPDMLGMFVWAERWFIPEFFDFESGHVNFDSPEFIAHVEGALQAFRGMPEALMQFDPNINRQELMARYFMFNNFFGNFGTWSFAMFGLFDDCYFGYALPLVNNDGELYIFPNNTWFLNANTTLTQQALALDFVRFIKDTTIPEVWHHHSMPGRRPLGGGIPINRDMFQRESRNSLRLQNTIMNRSQALLYPIDDAIEMFIERMYANINRPFAMRRYVPGSVREHWNGLLDQLHEGLISPDEAARNLHNHALRVIGN